MNLICRLAATLAIVACLPAACPALAQGLPPVPFPPENPPNEAKRVLGKILFWEEQLSSDDTMACGTCHVPGSGGADPRTAVNPGDDGLAGTDDDIHGSFGVVHRDANGDAVDDPVFGLGRQVTGRMAPSFFASLFAREMFWDGRASSTFADPLDEDSVLIANGGALESQSMGPILSSVEMAQEGRTWADVTSKLATARPLRLADDLPADVVAAIAARPSYAELFAAAFGDDEITPSRIAFAIATYERSLSPSQTPWDRFIAGDNTAMTAAQIQGWNVFRGGGAQCNRCHVPPMFTNNDFVNLGLRPAAEDEGRLAVSGLEEDFGDMKMPGLRNVGLRARLMHTGGITGVADAINFYIQAAGHQFFTADQDTIPPNNTPLSAIRIAPQDRAALVDFLSNGLTDPRVAAETFPFDRPTLGSELPEIVSHCTDAPRSDCRRSTVAGRARLGASGGGGSADTLTWKLTAVEATAAGDFTNPTVDGAIVFCMYEDDALVFESRAPAGAGCGDGTCWRTIGKAGAGKGYKYASSSSAPEGVRKMQLRAGASGKAKIVVALGGSAIGSAPLGAPALPVALPLTVQVQAEEGACWQASYASAEANTAAELLCR